MSLKRNFSLIFSFSFLFFSLLYPFFIHLFLFFSFLSYIPFLSISWLCMWMCCLWVYLQMIVSSCESVFGVCWLWNKRGRLRYEEPGTGWSSVIHKRTHIHTYTRLDSHTYRHACTTVDAHAHTHPKFLYSYTFLYIRYIDKVNKNTYNFWTYKTYN